MKDQVLRILKMVQEGRLTPEDAYDLMDAFCNFDGAPNGEPAEQKAAETKDSEDPFRAFVDKMEKLTKQAFDSVEWSQVAGHVKSATAKGMEALKTSVGEMSKGEFKFFWGGLNEKAEVELPLNIQPGGTLRIELRHGDVVVHGGSSPAKLKCSALIRGKSREEAKEHAEKWTAVLEEGEGFTSMRQQDDTVSQDVEVWIPEGVKLDIKLDSGDLKVTNTKAGCKVNSRHGDVSLQGVEGEVSISTGAGDVSIRDSNCNSVAAETKSGDVEVQRVTSQINIRSANGDIACREINSKQVTLEAVNGDITLDFASPTDGAHSVRSVSGDILVDLASGSNLRVSLATLSGEVHNRTKLEDEAKSKDRVTGRMGEGAGTIDVSAISGDVTLGMQESSA